MPLAVDALTDWLKDAWDLSNGLEEFRHHVETTLSSDDVLTVVGILQFGNQDDAYLAQIVLRILGSDATISTDQDGNHHFRVILNTNGEEFLITPEGLAAQADTLDHQLIKPDSGRPVAAIASALDLAMESNSVGWESLVKNLEQDLTDPYRRGWFVTPPPRRSPRVEPVRD